MSRPRTMNSCFSFYYFGIFFREASFAKSSTRPRTIIFRSSKRNRPFFRRPHFPMRREIFFFMAIRNLRGFVEGVVYYNGDSTIFLIKEGVSSFMMQVLFCHASILTNRLPRNHLRRRVMWATKVFYFNRV